jgi:hypothetical protein
MAGDQSTEPRRTDERLERPGLGRGAQFLLLLAAVALVAWFLYSWLVRGIRLADAAGESIGTALLLLIAVSIAGAIRRGRRP